MLLITALAALALAAPPAVDTDGDGVDDLFDDCPGSDDTIDLNGDSRPDCVQSMIPRSPIDSYADTTFWTPLNGVTFSNFSPEDLGGYTPSGSLLAEPDIQGYGIVGNSICVRLPAPYGDEIHVWAHGAADFDDVGSRVILQEYTTKNCTTSFGLPYQTSSYELIADGAIEVLQHDVITRSSTRSVKLTFEGGTAGEFLVDNILMLEIPATVGPPSDPPKKL